MSSAIKAPDAQVGANGQNPATSPRPTGRPGARRLAERLAALSALDPVADRLAATWRSALGDGPRREVLRGSWMGHALHPLLTDIPIGTWSSSAILDLIGGRASRQAADRLLVVGLLAAGPTAVTGWSDWTDASEAEREISRVGIVHAVSNVAAIGFFTASVAARRASERARGRRLSLAGLAALGVGGYLGGHLSYVHGSRVEAGPAG